MKDKQTDYKSDGGDISDKKRNKLAAKKRLKEALKAEKGTGSDYDGYTVKDHKRDMKAAGLKPFGGGKVKNKKAGTGNHPLNK